MFTGIVAETGRVQSVRRNAESCRIRIEAHSLWTEMELGDSVSVSGVCLTVVHLEDGIFEADVSSESLQRSNLGSKRVGDLVNLELAVRVGGRLGGHIVLGHVDGMGSVVRNELNGEGAFLTVQYRGSGSHLVVEKGSVAVDGVSLTVASLVGEDFGVAGTVEANVNSVTRVVEAGESLGEAVMSAAVGAAHELAHPGDTVLLAPAGASFDQFSGYGHRGDAFAAAVHALSR